ncbi:hypothetical protein L3556_06200 [Candidatus Synechococcus calcipolaris G9]|uniref:Uncharacterized protein n=1 Tax=Candidatus Synechococcus calcipolaris G9 TaxID=1497997 RepID=A0ABT6EXJ9_9SYNE|nr:hypothetical protein [Candidatus Synechococcus calcipolaris]MDG2990526.1 hypothetical protein [Candidatus Synechococcus calcipolaris G9]
MSDPWQAFKSLPWRSLIPAGLSIAVLANVFDTGLYYIAINSAAMGDILGTVLQPPLGLMVRLVMCTGLGMMAVLFLETFFDPGPIYSPTLWGLLLSALLSFMVLGVLSGFLSLRPVFFSLNELLLAGLAIGIFWQGRRYWRW